MPTDRVTIETKPIIALREFFNVRTNRPVTMAEFQEFWKVLSEEEKNNFREAIKAWDGESEYIALAK